MVRKKSNEYNYRVSRNESKEMFYARAIKHQIKKGHSPEKALELANIAWEESMDRYTNNDRFIYGAF